MSNLSAALQNTLDLAAFTVTTLEALLDEVNNCGWELSYQRAAFDEDEFAEELGAVMGAVARIKAELDARTTPVVAARTLSAKDVAVIAATAKSTRPRTRAEAYTLVKAADLRLKQHAANQLRLAEDVRLPMDAVIRLLWTIRKLALAQWRVARAADLVAAHA